MSLIYSANQTPCSDRTGLKSNPYALSKDNNIVDLYSLMENILTEDLSGSNSATALVTKKSLKPYLSSMDNYFSGDNGVRGYQGDQGPQGIQGSVGDIGPAGRDGDDLTVDFDSDSQLEFTPGPQGAVGEMGPQGSIGAQGTRGINKHNVNRAISREVNPYKMITDLFEKVSVARGTSDDPPRYQLVIDELTVTDTLKASNIFYETKL